jgi:hypothetical protein
VTVPTIGWTPRDRSRRWGFSVAKYGPQQQTECTASGGASWCNADAGNGLRPDGSAITGNDPHDTSREIGPDFVTAWMAHLAQRTGSAASGGVKLYALDNEPSLWNSTHRDVHPQPLTFDELWQRTRDYAAAIKATDAAASVLGPAEWGWCAYFGSAADSCTNGPDRAAHGGLALLEWYLQQVADYQQAHGVRLVDYLDIHYYPQAPGVALSDDESAATAARRLRTLRSLWDPTYVDESWIGTQVRLIPRMKEWIAARLPGTKLAITEYSFGNDNGPSSALAHAEALAIFAREGVDLATRWVAPADGTRVEDAFKLFLDYDGAGARVTGDSVRSTSASPDAVTSYAVQRADGRLYILLFNHDTRSRAAHLSVAGGFAATAGLFRFDASTRLGAAGTAVPQAGNLDLDLPARSATLAIVDGSQPGDGSCPVGEVLFPSALRLKLGGTGVPSRLASQGYLRTQADVDPASRGLTLRLLAASGAILEAQLGGPNAAVGFTHSGKAFTYSDATGSIAGITSVKVRVGALASDGLRKVKFRVRGRSLSLSPPAPPTTDLGLVLDFAPPCGSSAIGTLACVLRSGGSVIYCKPR